jgi:hypothetical protein
MPTEQILSGEVLAVRWYPREVACFCFEKQEYVTWWMPPFRPHFHALLLADHRKEAATSTHLVILSTTKGLHHANK